MANSNSNEPSSWSGPSTTSTTPQTRNHGPNHSSGTVTVRGFETRHRGPLTPVPEIPRSAESGGSNHAARANGDANGDAEDRGHSSSFFGHTLRRSSSVAERLGGLTDIGGVNSISNFARSWQRAAGFYEITPVNRSFVAGSDTESELDGEDDHGTDEEQAKAGTSLLREALQRERSRRVSAAPSVAASEARAEEAVQDGPSDPVAQRLRHQRSMRADSIFSVEPQLQSVFGGSYGATYGSLSSRVNESSMRHAGRLYLQQQASGVSEPDKEREPLLVRQVEQEDGKIINVVVGQSTLPQTIFNSVNVLIGVGMLTLPLAFRYGGWLISLTFFTLSAIVTSYTAKLLAKCLDVDGSLITFADLAYVSFGPRARIYVSILFTLELVATCVALVMLFADSLNALVPGDDEEGWQLTQFKILCGFIIIPLGFFPLRFLSFTSILGILSCLGIVVAVFVDGLIKPHSPGSLREPAQTYLFPADWRTLPLSFGLLMAPWGGHSVFPNIYRDMRHPYKYGKGVNYTYLFTYFLEAALGVVGYLMFGEGVLDELTKNIFITDGYPHWLSICVIVAIAIIPLTKIPLNARPIISTVEIFTGLDSRAMPGATSMAGMSNLTRGILKLSIRIITPILFVILAILVPSFDRIMSLLGSLACFTICIILPCAFHLKIFGSELSYKQRALDWTLIVICSILALMGTVCSCLPKSLLGAEVGT